MYRSAPPELLPRIIDAATARRVARMQYLRTVRRSWSLASPARVHSKSIALAFAWLAAAMAGAGAAYLALGAAEPRESLVLVVFLGAAFVALVGLAVWLTTRLERAAAWWSPMRDVSRQLGGSLGSEPARRLEWLDRYWLGDLSSLDVQRSAHGGVITLVAHGYPVLIVFDPLPITGLRGARLELFLAASLPSSEGSQPTSETRDWFARRGFELRGSEAGLRATATAVVIRALDDALDAGPYEGLVSPEHDPSGARHWLVPIVYDLATTAASLGASPVAPIP